MFPLPLTPFERYYLADDSPEYPTTIPVDVLLHGALEEGAFRRALARNVARHPLLHALVADDSSVPQWVAFHGEPFLDWAQAGEPIGHPDGEYIDLRKSPGLRIWVRTLPDEARVLIQLHHACCDGVSTLQFIGDLLALYAEEQQGLAPGAILEDLPAERLRDRAAVDVGASGPAPWYAGPRDLLVTARVWGRLVLGKCCAVVPPDRHDRRHHVGASPASTRDFLTFETHVLSAEQTRQLKKAAAARRVTPNDLLLRDAFVAVRQWNEASDVHHWGACRINMPVYVRSRTAPPIPASNGIGFAFVTIQPKGRSGDWVLDEVHAQTQQIKNWKLALYFLGGLAAAINRARAVRWVLDRKRPLATMVLSNLGQVLTASPLPRLADGRLVCGNVVLEHVAGVPPVRPLTRASMVVMEYAGRLAIALRCDTHSFRPQDTHALLDAFVSQVCAANGSLWCEL